MKPTVSPSGILQPLLQIAISLVVLTVLWFSQSHYTRTQTTEKPGFCSWHGQRLLFFTTMSRL